MKKQGFTLIELLAVIVILAIIALIAVPLVLNIISDSKEKAFENSVEHIKKAAELKVANMMLNNEEIVNPMIFKIEDLDLENKEILTGTVEVVINKNNKLKTTVNVTDENYIYRQSGLVDKNKAYVIPKKDNPKAKYITIDEKNNLIYGFDITWTELTSTGLNPEEYLTAVNGTLEFEANESGTYSTGSKVILKDNSGNIIKEYYIVIFGDTDGDNMISGGDYTTCSDMQIYPDNEYTIYEKKATEINDCNYIADFDGWLNDGIDQVYRKLIPST